MVEGVEFQNLPEGCIANTLSFTSPRDACGLSLVSKTFRSAADSDSVWERFLPSDYQSIISRSSDSSCSSFHSKKQLYQYLCQKPLIIDDGRMSFQLDKACGKKCFMLSARGLVIVWGDTPRYWVWTSLPEARFPEVAELLNVCYLEIRGWANTRMLSPDTLYGAYFVFKPSLGGCRGFDHQSVEVSVKVYGDDTRKRTVFLDPERGRRMRYQIVPRPTGIWAFNRIRAVAAGAVAAAETQAPSENHDEEYPKQREDGWLEMELGDFFNKGGEGREVEVAVWEIEGGNWKGGLVVQGIEIRPKTISVHKMNE